MKNLILIALLSITTSFGALVELKWNTSDKQLSRTDLKPTFAAITNSAATASTLAGYDANKGLISLSTLAALEAAIGSVNVLSATELDTLAELETILGGANVIVSTEMDSIAELESLLGSVNILLKTEIDSQSEFESLLFTLPGSGTSANWTALGSTNSELPGISYQHYVVSTNGFESLGDGTIAGFDVFWDSDGSQHARLTAPSDITGDYNWILPPDPGSSGVLKQTVLGTNVTSTFAALATVDLPSGGTLDSEWDAIAEIEAAIGGLNIILETEFDSGAELLDLFDDETGTGVPVFSTAPTITNPTLTSLIATLNAAADGLTDDTYDGTTLTGRNGGETIAQWELVRFNSADSEFHLADANAAGEFPARGIAVASSSDGAAITVLVNGIVRNDGWAWGTVGGPIYLSETAGALTQTAPSTSGSAVQIVGWALSDDEAYLNFSGHYLEVE